YAARADVQSVFHLHSVAGVVVASQPEGLLPLSQNAMLLRDRIRHYPYTGARIDRDESARMATALGDGTVLLLRNHGTLVVGRSIGEAFAFVVRAEKAFAIQLAAQAAQVPLLPASAADEDEAAALGLGLYRQGGASPAASVEWAALLRKAVRDSPGFDR
ncbi:MAG: class aldolase/adducin family protein, partial [Rhodoferax sp.]|nr:class aldolase/adducin family protein [Rhodoferax sp.]